MIPGEPAHKTDSISSEPPQKTDAILGNSAHASNLSFQDEDISIF